MFLDTQFIKLKHIVVNSYKMQKKAFFTIFTYLKNSKFFVFIILFNYQHKIVKNKGNI